MTDTFTITIIVLVISTAVAALIKGRTRDNCLKGFSANLVVLEMKDGKTVTGKINIETTGLELIYPQPNPAESGALSYILYKTEYQNILVISRLLDKLAPEECEARNKDLKKTYRPSWFNRLKRKTRNLFATIRDSVTEIINLFIGRFSAGGIGAKIMAGQQKYINQVQQEVATSLNTSFEPLLEKHIGQKVMIMLKKGENYENIIGILKEYTSSFLTLMDTAYPAGKGTSDIIVLRDNATVRHIME
ncbi:MAG: hypothetical protein A2252_12295 [Elusimicrobia bacterium RIFOXYA2_FULL_39_19]|nr:MAG: hypothetical protein A2252_12295 [Elusimicrobia bacterium RIFOXYA2_FULL_39_19]